MATSIFPLKPDLAGQLATEIAALPGVAGVAICDEDGILVAGAGSIRPERDGPLALFIRRRGEAMTEVDDLRGLGPAVSASHLRRIFVQGKSGPLVICRPPGCLVLAVLEEDEVTELSAFSIEKVVNRYLRAA